MKKVVNQKVSYEDIYLPPNLWTIFDQGLVALEIKHGLVRHHVTKSEKTFYFPNYHQYNVWYEKCGIKQQRQFMNDVREFWGKVPNKLSRYWK